MTLDDAMRKIDEAIDAERALADPSREDAQYRKGRRDGLAFARKALAKARGGVLEGPRRELARLRKEALRLSHGPITPEGRAREAGEAWAYMKALNLLWDAESESESEKEEET